MNYPSPRTPGHYPDNSYEYWDAGPSPTPTPPYQPMATPRRTSTAWGHVRGTSYSSPRPSKDSPRFNSQGYYATATDPRPSVSDKHFYRPSGATQHSSKRERRHSSTFVRTSTPYGESDEDEIFEAWGRTYVLPAQSKSRRSKQPFNSSHPQGYWHEDGAWFADHDYLQTHRRQASGPVPYRPGTAVPRTARRPSVSTSTKQPPKRRQATEKDRAKYAIREDYSTKNWDPEEVPILLLGSVFDANSLGKWIYDWTVHKMGPTTPISDMAGDLWLLLIKLYGKVKKAEDTVIMVRTPEAEETLDYFINVGNKLQEKWLSLLKHCEKPMLAAGKKKDSNSLGFNSGVRFVETLFGRDKRLEETEKFMAKVREFILRFDNNCETIIRNPTR
ncbi:hypothetical protein CC79DRAFT_1272044 [Sarocladium strictum]